MEDIKIRFAGDGAKQHRIPAFAASDTIGGVALALHRAAFLVEHGKARYKGPYSENVRIEFGPPEPGSVLLPIFLEVASGLSKRAIKSAAKYIFSEATGQGGEALPASLKNVPSGSVSAAIESVEKPLMRAHNIILESDINIYLDFSPSEFVKLDDETADYLNTTIYDKSIQYSVGSVSSMNANDRSGRMFIKDIGHNVTFKLSDDSSVETVDVLMSSFRRYFSHFGGDLVEVRHTSYRARDGKLKWMLIESAELKDSA